ncbi:hypothetical protein Hanom_Chr07g00675571 [Helianthus anomalus]
MEEVEEGEFRKDDDQVPVPDKKVTSPVDRMENSQGANEKSSVSQESPECQESQNVNGGMENLNVHADVDNLMHGSNCNVKDDVILENSKYSSVPNVTSSGGIPYKPNNGVGDDPQQ